MQNVRETPPSLFVRQLAVEADAARRTAAFWRRACSLAPVVAAGTVGLAVGSAVFDWPRWPSVLALGAAALVGLVGWIAARHRRPVSEPAILRLDRDAELGGAFQSAHWFASAPGAGAATVDEAWVAFHLSEAARAAAGVDWASVYARPRFGKAVAAATLALVLTVTFTVWPSPDRHTPRSIALSRVPTGDRSDSDGALPAALVSGLVEGVEAIRVGRAPSAEALAAIGQILEIADREPVAQQQLEDLLKEAAPSDSEGAAPVEANREPNHARVGATPPSRGILTQPGLEWAYQEALARGVEARQPSVDPDPTVVAGDAEPGDGSQGDLDHGGRGPQPGAPAQAEAKGDVSSFSSLLFGQHRAGDGALSGAAGRTSSPLAAALRHEVVHAEVDIAVSGGERSAARRATTVGRSASGALGATAGLTYDRGRAAEPPPVPDARRAVVRDYFVRHAEPPSPTTPP